jgi:very-short-patch-repair endonuclease
VFVHETNHLPDIDRTTIDDCHATTVARTLCDLVTVLRPANHRRVVQTALVERRVTPGELIACHRAMSRRGRRGVAAMRRLLVDLVDDEPYPQSELEYRLTVALARRGLGYFRRQYAPPWYDGVSGIVDFADPIGCTILEADGRRWHTVDQDRRRDAERDRLAARNGWLVLRVGWHEVVHRTDSVLEEIAHIVAVRRAA